MTIRLTDPTAALTLLRWTEELPSDSAQDPLGLKLRLSARLAAELMHCITSITPRARYFAFFPWAVGQYLAHEKDTAGDRGRDLAVVHRERALALGSLLHHGYQPCLGSLAARPATDGHGLINLAAWRHLQNPRGILGQAYKGSLVNLGLFDARGSGQSGEAVADDATEGAELAVAVQEIDLVHLSDRGRRLAEAYGATVDATRYVAEGWHLRTAIPADVLREFGAAACLCGIARPGARDRGALRDVFFAVDRAGTETAHYRRRMTLTLLLECAHQTSQTGAALDEDAFAAIAYEDAFTGDATGTQVRLELPAQLRDIAERWRVFLFHGLASVALQAMLVAVVRTLRDHPGGLRRQTLADALYGHARITVERLFESRLARDVPGRDAAGPRCRHAGGVLRQGRHPLR